MVPSNYFYFRYAGVFESPLHTMSSCDNDLQTQKSTLNFYMFR